MRGVLVHAALVHGAGGGAIPLVVGAEALRAGSPARPGAGTTAWSAVHVADLAALLVLCLERAPAGADLDAAAEDVTTAQLADAVGAALGLEGPVRELDAEGARTAWGFFGPALGLSQRVAGRAARELGWEPRGPGLAESLRREPLVLGPPG